MRLSTCRGSNTGVDTGRGVLTCQFIDCTSFAVAAGTIMLQQTQSNRKRNAVFVVLVIAAACLLILEQNSVHLRGIIAHISADVCLNVPSDNSTAIEPLIAVEVNGTFDQRVQKFNDELQNIRRRILRQRGLGTWCNKIQGATVDVFLTLQPDYVDKLAAKYPDVTTVVLPWQNVTDERVWNSLTDTANLPRQQYFEWTADDTLCQWIETPVEIKLFYDLWFNCTCERDISKALTPQSLRPIFLNPRALGPLVHGSRVIPERLLTRPPPYVFQLHIHRDAVVTSIGDVFSRGLKLVLYSCSEDIDPNLPNLYLTPVYDEVFVMTQHWGKAVFHRMVEVVPRVVLFRDFLRQNPQIRIVAPERSGGRLSELLRMIDVDVSRLVVGPVRAKVAYQPRSTKCGFANVQESQTLNLLYVDYIRRTFPAQPRNGLVLIRRSGSRRFAEQGEVEEVLERAASDYNLTYTLFMDNPTPSLYDTMTMFHSAVMVVAPHGAGEANLLFSQPGTFVVEGVCNLPHVNLCYQRLAHILGHYWHGVTSRGGCEDVIDVGASSIAHAVYSYLRLWESQNTE